jgi:hypothetical protein
LFVICAAAFAQNPSVPTLKTVVKGGTTTNVYTYRNENGRTVRVLEYYENRNGSFGHSDSTYDDQGNVSFNVQTDCGKKGDCSIKEQRYNYSDNELQTLDERVTTFKPDGKMEIFSFTKQVDDDDTSTVNGMCTDARGRKFYDFTEKNYVDEENNNVSLRTVNYWNNVTELINTTTYPNKTKVRSQSTFDQYDNQTRAEYTEYGANGKESYSSLAYFTYNDDGTMIAERVLSDAQKGTQLVYTELRENDGMLGTSTGHLMNKNGEILADFSMEETINEDGSVYKVQTYVYPNGRVDMISETKDAFGNLTVNKMLDFKAAGEPDENMTDSEWDSFISWILANSVNDQGEIDEETLRYFDEISDVWGEYSEELDTDWSKDVADDLDMILDTRSEEDSEDSETPEEDSKDSETPEEDSKDSETPEEDSKDSETPEEDNSNVSEPRSEDDGDSDDDGSDDDGSDDDDSDDDDSDD